MKTKISKLIAKFAVVLAVCTLFASFSPSLDGRAVVADEGQFPEGLFAKTVGYLPGDVLSVTNISGNATVDILVIGALDSSEGVAIMLSPEAAKAVGIEKNSNNIVKITKRTGQDERVFGTAVIAKSGDTPVAVEEEKPAPVTEETVPVEEESAPVDEETSQPEAAFEESAAVEAETEEAQEEFFEEPADEEFTDEEFTEEELAPAEEEAPEAEAFTDEAPEDFEEEAEEEAYSDDGADEYVEEDSEEELESEAYEEEAPADFEEETEEETEDDSFLEEDEEEFTDPEEELDGEAYEEEAPADFEEESEETFEEESDDFAEEELEEEQAPESEFIEAEGLESLESESEEESEVEPEVEPETAVEEEELAADEETEEYEEETEEYDAIVLVPADDFPPVKESVAAPVVEEDEVEVVDETPAVEETPAEELVAEVIPAPVESVVVPAPKPADDFEKYTVGSLSDLISGKYYIQIAVLRDKANIEEIINKYGKHYPIVLVPTASGTAKQVMVGPLSIDEYGTVLARFKANGFKDAFLRKIK
ncbi:MAG: SPOR domain-containing protein [Treponema sp.]|nr:SPOR domain-containing protein [Treponema sp.]